MTTVCTSSGKSETDVMNVMWLSNYLKSTFGLTHVKVFGYKVQNSKWCFDDDCMQAVTYTLMPTDLKEMQRCLGVGIFLSEFLPDYATKLAELYNMIKPTFN
jgi:hypothetical protein